MHRRMLLFVLAVVRHPVWTLVICGVVLVASVVLAAAQLNISSDQNKLFSPKAPFFRDYLSFVEKFPENEAIYLIVEPKDRGTPTPVRAWTEVADALVDRLKRMSDVVRSVDGRVPIDKLGDQGLLFDSPQRVKQTLDEMKRFVPLVKLWAEKPNLLERALGPTPLERFLSGLAIAPPDAETRQFANLLAESWTKTLASDRPVLPDLASLDAEDPSRLGYYYVPDASEPTHKLLLVRVYPKVDYATLTAVSDAVDAIRDAANQTVEKFPAFVVGVTGRPALEADEMRTTDEDSTKAEIVALSVVFVGLVALFRSFWIALAAEIALAVSIGWTFGWATLTVGELNLLSIVFLIALIGIGMDYLIQILSRYRHDAGKYDAVGVWVRVFKHVGAPINTACLGAAGAFLVAVFTDFRGAAQLGIIAGGGLLLCLLAGYTALPALLTLVPLKVSRRGTAVPAVCERNALRDTGESAEGSEPVPRSGYATPSQKVARWWFLLPTLWIILLILGIPFMRRAYFDPGLLDLQNPDLQSVKLVRKLDTWSAVVLSKDLQTLQDAREHVATRPTVASTDSILLAHDNAAWLDKNRDVLPKINWTEPANVEANRVDEIATKATNLAKRFAATQPTEDWLGPFAITLKSTDAKTASERLSRWQTAFIEQLKQTLSQFAPGPLELDRIPPELKSHYVAADGTYALYVYPKQDLWQREHLTAFVEDVGAGLQDLKGDYVYTGIAPNIFHSTKSIESSFYKTTAYALALIFVLVLLDFRRLGPTFLAISVLAFGLPMLVALMGLLDVSWNFANFFGLPILIGAGHEYGVFMVHRFLETKRDPRRVWGRWDVSDKALLLCAFVTSSAFAFFWVLGHHRGLRSLGLVMALGSVCIYLATIMVVRPVLKWRLATKK